MKVQIIYQYFQDHTEPGHSLIYEVAHYLADNGHDVTVVAGECGYMKRRKIEMPWYKRLLRRDDNGKVKVIRTYTYSELHRSYIGRLFSFLSFSLFCPFGMLWADKPDIVLASSPPIFPMIPAWAISKLRRVPFVLEVRDVWPEAAIQMGILHNRMLIKIMMWMERLLYNHSDKVVALTEGIRKDICARGWPETKIVSIPCGVDAGFLYPDAEGGRHIRERYGWTDKKIVLYFGALGEANNIPVILRAARQLKNRDDILFVLIGDGMMKESIERTRAEQNLDNVVIMPPVPKSEARFYINAADICLVTLLDIPLFGMSAIPTKLVDYMACGRPILYGAKGETEQILASSGSGWVFSPDNDRLLAGYIVKLIENPDIAATMGAGGPPYVAANFALSVAQRRMKDLLEEVNKLDKCA